MKDSCITEVSNLGSKTVTFYTDEETVMAFMRMNVNAVFGKVWLDRDLGLVQMTRRSMKAEEMVARLGGAIRGIAREAGREVADLGGAAAFQGEWFEPGDEVVPGRDVRTCVTEVGSLGSKVVTFETDAETVAAIARLDLSAEFGPVLLDPGHGIVNLTRPSVRHEHLVAAVDEWIREAIRARGEAGQSLRGCGCAGRPRHGGPVWRPPVRSTSARAPADTTRRAGTERTRWRRSYWRRPPSWWWRSRRPRRTM